VNRRADGLGARRFSAGTLRLLGLFERVLKHWPPRAGSLQRSFSSSVYPSASRSVRDVELAGAIMNEQQQSGLTQRLRRDGKQKLESGKRSAAAHIEEVAHAIDRAGTQLDEKEPTLAAYASQIAAGVSKLATRLREDSFDDLLDETRQLARRNPALFLASGVVLGIAASRFLKASAERTDQADESTASASSDDSTEDEAPISASYNTSFERSDTERDTGSLSVPRSGVE
jgi:hypothetical protein